MELLRTAVLLTGVFLPINAAFILQFGHLLSKCTETTWCLPIGRWPGGLGNCLEGICDCKISSDCYRDRECCSGKCNLGIKSCAARSSGDMCMEYEKKHPCGLEPAHCHIPSPNLNVRNYDKGRGTCDEVIADKVEICGPVGHWDGGIYNSFRGRCDCRLREECEGDVQCCSGACEDGKCNKGAEGDLCEFDTCAEGYQCQIPSPNPYVHSRFNAMIGTCQDLNNVTVTYYTANLAQHESSLTQYFDNCTPKSLCARVGTWPGGLGSCLEDKCECQTDGQCERSRQCCSGRCRKGTCQPGQLGSICRPDSCATGYYCRIPSFDLNVAKRGADRGICLEIAVVGSECDNDTLCRSYGAWLGGKGVCTGGHCGCQMGVCDGDAECCSGNCSNRTCAPGKSGDSCFKGPPQTCAYGYTCSSDPWVPQSLNETTGTCTENAAYGAMCNASITCAAVSSWPGGLANCINGLCSCILAESVCKDNRQCCSGICSGGQCAPGKISDICSRDTCAAGYTCYSPWPQIPFLQNQNPRRGICQGMSDFRSDCDNTTMCRPFGSWVGGLGHCLVTNQCGCLTASGCNQSSHCCSGKCVGGSCLPGQLGDLCSRESCAADLFCLIPSSDPNVARMFGSMWGSCEFKPKPGCQPFLSGCDSKTDCCPTRGWIGGLGNCLQNKCYCRILGKCTRNHQCCSNLCAGNKCAAASIRQFCSVSRSSCVGTLSCVQLEGNLNNLGICT